MRTTLTFIGTATVLLRLGGMALLTDPNFLHRGERAYLGYGLFTKRRSAPALGLDELPALDAVVLSHLHGDHFDRRARHGLARDLPILTTPHAARRLARWNFDEAQPLPTWQSQVVEGDGEYVRVTSTPGQHGPAGVRRLLPPVMGSIVDYVRGGILVGRLYITGDTLLRPFVTEIPQRFPDIDVVIAHLGATKLAGALVTMDARQGAALARTVRPHGALPIHCDDYTVFHSTPRAFVAQCDEQGFGGWTRALRRGEEVELPQRG